MKTLFRIFIAIALLQNTLLFSQEATKDSTKTKTLEDVIVTSTRVQSKSPFAYTTIKKEQLKATNLGQDLPFLLDQLPSVVTTSDAGTGVGYTGIRIRGSDATRVNVTLNGIPYNDAESHGTFWVNMPDFTSSVEDIQIQRGAGTSTNGSGAFGASLNLRTLKPSSESYAIISNSIGSFGTRKHTISLSSGIKNGWYAMARLSKIASDGFIDRASSDLKSFFTEAGYVGTKTSIKALVFGGKEITYQSWFGTPEAVVNGDIAGIYSYINRNYATPEDAYNLLTAGRKYNFYTYANQVDNYEQKHYQLHITHQFNDYLNASISGNFTQGKGYYEEYKAKQKVKKYFPDAANGSDIGDVIRRKWLDNDFYAIVYSLNYQKDKFSGVIGGGYNKYDGDHFGQIIWDSFPISFPKDTPYYKGYGLKEDFSTFVKADYTFTEKIIGYVDLQVRQVDYSATGKNGDLKSLNVSKKYAFFNPKAGVTILLNKQNKFFASVAVANKEPNRDDLTKNPKEPSSERLIDYEMGYTFNHAKWNFNATAYYMNYKNQLVLTGAIDDTGGPIRENVAKSYRMGLEFALQAKITDKLKAEINTTISENKIRSFDYKVADTQYDPVTFEESYFTVTTRYNNSAISFSPSLISSGSLSYNPVKNWQITLLAKHVGKQYLDNTATNSRSIKAYTINNLSSSFSIHPKWIQEINFNVLVNNIWNKKYESNGYTYSYYYRPLNSNDRAVTENFYYPQAGINLLTGITLKF